MSKLVRTIILRKGAKDSSRRFVLKGNIEFTPALMYYQGAWARTQVFCRRSDSGGISYLCPFCVSENRAFELFHTKRVGVLRIQGKLVGVDVHTPSRVCSNVTCKRRFVLLKGIGETPVDLDTHDIPFVAVD